MASDPSSLAEKAARALSLRLGAILVAPVGERPLAAAWRVKRASPPEGADDPTRALFVARPEAPGSERKAYVAAAERIAQLPEPLLGVLRVHAVDAEDQAFVTDLWTTGSARDLGALGWPASRRVDFVRQMAEIVERLHAAGIVHGCLCEENVLLDDDLKPVLAEAGAVSVHAVSERGGDAASYVAFAAPEVLEGGEPDARSDVYSLGRLLQHFVRADDVPQAAEVIRRCVAPLAPGRYPTAAAVAQAIAGVVAAIGVETKPAAAPAPKEPKASADAAPVAVAPAAASSTPASEPGWIAPVGGILAVGAVAIAAMGLGSSGGAQTAVSLALVVGVGLAATALRPTPRTARSLRLGFALSAAALVAVADPLSYAYRSAAERAMHSSPEARRAAVDQIVRLGRDFQNMTLSGVDLSGADLRGADLRGADLSQANLSHVDLTGAMLVGASFAEAQLASADLRQTDLARARFGEARCDDRTLLSPPMRCASGTLSDTPVPAAAPTARVAPVASASASASASANASADAGAPAAPPPLEGGAPPR